MGLNAVEPLPDDSLEQWLTRVQDDCPATLGEEPLAVYNDEMYGQYIDQSEWFQFIWSASPEPGHVPTLVLAGDPFSPREVEAYRTACDELAARRTTHPSAPLTQRQREEDPPTVDVEALLRRARNLQVPLDVLHRMPEDHQARVLRNRSVGRVAELSAVDFRRWRDDFSMERRSFHWGHWYSEYLERSVFEGIRQAIDAKEIHRLVYEGWVPGYGEVHSGQLPMDLRQPMANTPVPEGAVFITTRRYGRVFRYSL